MANKNIRTISKAAAFAILASISFAVACGDDDSAKQVKPPSSTGGMGGEGTGGKGSSTGGSDGTGASNTGGMGGEGTGGMSDKECFVKDADDKECFDLSVEPKSDGVHCSPLNSDEFKNARPACDGSCDYFFDNSTLTKLNADGSLPPLN